MNADDIAETFGFIDFTKDRRSPMLMVPCPTCKANQGALCQRPSQHTTQQCHAARGALADEVFIRQHGEDAALVRTENGARPFTLVDASEPSKPKAARQEQKVAQMGFDFS